MKRAIDVTIKDIKERAVPVLKDAGVLHSSLFGSYVRGEQTEESDIDILIEFPRGKSLLVWYVLKWNWRRY